MTITDERIGHLAREAVTGAIQNLANNAVGLGERLYDEPGVEYARWAEKGVLPEGSPWQDGGQLS